MKLAIKKHWIDFLAILGVAILGVGIAVYLLSQQDFRFPLVEAKPKQIELQLENAQAVQPGQGQTVRVAGVEVGRIADVKLDEGVAVVTLEIKPEYKNLIRQDATALLRPKTALKDMFVEVDPGHGKPVPDGGTIPVGQHAAGHRPRRDLLRARRRHAAVPEAARHRRRQGPARTAATTFARCSGASSRSTATSPASRARRAVRRTELKRADPRLRPPDDRARQAPAGPAPARQRVARGVRRARRARTRRSPTSVARLPGVAARLRRARSAKVRQFAPVLRARSSRCAPPIRKLPATNAARHAVPAQTRAGHPHADPPVRARRAAVDRRPALRGRGHREGDARPDAPRSASSTASSTWARTTRAAPRAWPASRSPSSAPARRASSTGSRWTAQNGISLFSTRRRPGPVAPGHDLRRPRPVLDAHRQRRPQRRRQSNPGLVEQLTGGTGHRRSPAARPEPARRPAFGSCNFNDLPPRREQEPAQHSDGSPRWSASRCRCSALLLFLWVVVRRHAAAAGRRATASRPPSRRPSLLVKEADVRMAGVNIGKVKQKELGPGGRTHARGDGDRPPLRADQDATRTRSCARRASSARPTWRSRPGQPGAKTLARRRDARRARSVDDTVQLDEVFRAFDPRTRQRLPGVAARVRDRHHAATFAPRLQRLARERGAVLQGRRRPAAAAGRPGGGAPAASFRDTGRVFHAVSRENGQLRGLITNGDATFGALASRDDALAETFQILPTFLRETRATVRRLEAFAAQHRPAGARPARSRRDDLAPDAARPRRRSRPTSSSCSTTSHPLVRAPRRPACRRPRAS